jgi:hypothetical protein
MARFAGRRHQLAHRRLSPALSGQRVMRELIAESDILVDQTGYWKRMPILSGLFWGGGMFLASPFIVSYPIWSSGMMLFFVGLACLLAGVLFAVFFTLSMRLVAWWEARLAYRGKGKWSTSPPPPEGAAYRLPCSRVLPPQRLMPGNLYLGCAGLFFVPIRMRRQSSSTPLMLPLDAVSPRAVPMELSGLNRLLLARPPLLLEVGADENVVRFLVPNGSQTIPRVIAAIAALGSSVARPG